MAIVDKSLAVGLRRSYARNTDQDLGQHVKKTIKSGKDTVSFERLLGRGDVICGKRIRRPSPGTVAGADIVYIDHFQESGELLFSYDQIDKRGELLKGRLSRVLMAVSRHGVESLYQRLKTHEWKIVITELRSVGAWFFENMHVVAMEEEGFLVTPTGVFPVVRGSYEKNEQFEGKRHWVATTWISQANLEDHTPYKLRVAEAVRAASGKGVHFFKL